MSAKNKNNETTEERTANLIERLTGKVEGLTPEVMAQMDLQDLQTIADNLALVNKTDGGKTRSNVSTEVLAKVIGSGETSISQKDLHEMVQRANLSNYFNTPEGYDFNKPISLINIDILLNKIKSSKDSASQAQRQTEWLKRAKAYTNSHLTGKSNSGSLFNNSSATHYFVEENGSFILTEK
jgi:CRISPR/Cas system-associated endonuclease Cas1